MDFAIKNMFIVNKKIERVSIRLGLVSYIVVISCTIFQKVYFLTITWNVV